MTIQAALNKIQCELNAPKNQFNKFGKYNYRSCEDILEGVKPLLNNAILVLNDEIVEIGGRIYVKAVATLSLDGESITGTAFARESETKKGMDESQITGCASSYARKYALNGLFCIDDSKDADTDESANQSNNAPQQAVDDKPWFNDFDSMQGKFLASIQSSERTPQQIIDNLAKTFKINKEVRAKIMGLK